MVKRVFVFVVLVTWALAMMDWLPIHQTWWGYGNWPEWAGKDFQQWSEVRRWTALLVCPPCGALAENYYFALMAVEAGESEQHAVHPMPYSGNPLWPDGPRFWWNQGEGAGWRPVSMIAWYLYWLPPTVLWWWLYAGDLFAGRWPWWTRWIGLLWAKRHLLIQKRVRQSLGTRLGSAPSRSDAVTHSAGSSYGQAEAD